MGQDGGLQEEASSERRGQSTPDKATSPETRAGFRQYLICILPATRKDTASLKREQSEIREDCCERKPCLNPLQNKNGLWVLNGKFVFLLLFQINPWKSPAEYKMRREGQHLYSISKPPC